MFKRSSPKYKIAFLAQNGHVWSSLHSVWEAFKEDLECETSIISLPLELGDSLLDKTGDNFLKSMKLPFIDYKDFTLTKICPDIIFLQNPYDDSRPQGFRLEDFTQTKSRPVYIPYCMEIYGQETSKYHFTLPVIKNSWRVIARSESHKRMFQQYSLTLSENVTVLGCPKIDMFKSYVPSLNFQQLQERIKGRKVFLWAPHFSIEPNVGFSTFLKYASDLISYFQQHQELYLIFRPHPLLFSKLRNFNPLLARGFDALFSELQIADNMHYDKDYFYYDSFYISDAMIVDASSLALEYLYTGKPLLFCFDQDPTHLNNDGFIVSYFYKAYSVLEIFSFIDMVKNGQDPMKVQRKDIADKFILSPDGKTGKRIKDYLKNELIKELK